MFKNQRLKRYLYCPEWKDNKPVEVVTDDLNEARSKRVYCYKNGTFTNDLIEDQLDKFKKREDRDRTCKNWDY